MNRNEWLQEFNGRVDACERWFCAWQRYMETLSPEHRLDGEWEHHPTYRGHQEARAALTLFVLVLPPL